MLRDPRSKVRRRVRHVRKTIPTRAMRNCVCPSAHTIVPTSGRTRHLAPLFTARAYLIVSVRSVPAPIHWTSHGCLAGTAPGFVFEGGRNPEYLPPICECQQPFFERLLAGLCE